MKLARANDDSIAPIKAHQNHLSGKLNMAQKIWPAGHLPKLEPVGSKAITELRLVERARTHRAGVALSFTKCLITESADSHSY